MLNRDCLGYRLQLSTTIRRAKGKRDDRRALVVDRAASILRTIAVATKAASKALIEVAVAVALETVVVVGEAVPGILEAIGTAQATILEVQRAIVGRAADSIRNKAESVRRAAAARGA